MKVLFINPSETREPDVGREKMRISLFYNLGLGYIISYIEKHSDRYEIDVFDALIEGDYENGVPCGGRIRYGATDDAIRGKIVASNPGVVGVSCLFPSSEWDALNALRIAKEVNPRIATILGGVHATNNAAALLRDHSEIDYIVLGEGEVTILKLLEHIRKRECREIETIPGVACRRGESVVVSENKNWNYIANIAEIPFPDRERFQMRKYLQVGDPHSHYRHKPYTQIITSRGCPLSCTYCSLKNHWGRQYRFRSPKDVVDEIEYLVNKFGIREIHFEDDNFTASRRRVLEIFALLKERGIRISLHCPSGTSVQHLDEELIVAMKEAGFYSISMGIESGDETVLKELMKKNVDLKKIPRLVDTMRRVGIDAKGFFILGYPGETQETILKTVNLAKSLQLDWSYFFIFSPFPNTPIYDVCVEKGYIEKGQYDKGVYNFRKCILKNVAFDAEWLDALREEAIIDCNFKNNPNRLRKNYAKAIDDIGAVVKMYPNFDFANFYLAETYHEMGDASNAVRYWKRTVEVNPAHEGARKRLEEAALINLEKPAGPLTPAKS